MASGEGPL